MDVLSVEYGGSVSQSHHWFPFQMKRQNHAARVIQQHYRLYKRSLLQDKRHEVERATRVMEELCR